MFLLQCTFRQRSTTQVIQENWFQNTKCDRRPPTPALPIVLIISQLNQAPPNTDNPQTNDAHVYSRLSAPNTTRLEAILSSLLNGPAISYASGLSAFHALLTYLNPTRVAIGAGYHGCHGVLDLHLKVKTGSKKIKLHATDADWDAEGLGRGDLVHVETPLNPTGEAYDIASFAKRAHARGAWLSVDSTFGPPGLQDPFLHGADVVIHSGTKYLGGHSDMLCGVLALNAKTLGKEKAGKTWTGLYEERVFLGSVMGSLEGWLGLRSLRTLELRVRRQSDNATNIVSWLDAALRDDPTSLPPDTPPKSIDAIGATVDKVLHASLQARDPSNAWLHQQMPHGYGPVFAILLKDETMAKTLPSRLDLFHHATSLGGVESLIEWRRMSDASADVRLLRVSVGVEDARDLWRDLARGLGALR